VIMRAERAWGAFRFVQRVQARLAARLADGLSMKAGVAEASGPVARETLLRHADSALTEAKRLRRAILVYSPDLETMRARPDVSREQHHLKTLATALARAVDAKDSYTRSHCETVSETAALIGAGLGLDPEHVGRLRLAGLLHDVGKIGIADAILQKPAPLNEHEFTVMKTHSALGHRIVSGAGLEEEAEWILRHHERPDGRGYPAGLRGDDVPLESRIILVADAFEAITSDRPYRAGRPEAEALAELDRHAGTQFDPACVAALWKALGRQRPDTPAELPEPAAERRPLAGMAMAGSPR